MLLIVNIIIVLTVNYISAGTDEPLNYLQDVSQDKNIIVNQKGASELLKSTLNYGRLNSSKSLFKRQSKLEIKTRQTDSIIDESYAKYRKQGVRLKRAKNMYRNRNFKVADEENDKEKQHDFVQRLIPSLLPIPNYMYPANDVDDKYEVNGDNGKKGNDDNASNDKNGHGEDDNGNGKVKVDDNIKKNDANSDKNNENSNDTTDIKINFGTADFNKNNEDSNNNNGNGNIEDSMKGNAKDKEIDTGYNGNKDSGKDNNDKTIKHEDNNDKDNGKNEILNKTSEDDEKLTKNDENSNETINNGKGDKEDKIPTFPSIDQHLIDDPLYSINITINSTPNFTTDTNNILHATKLEENVTSDSVDNTTNKPNSPTHNKEPRLNITCADKNCSEYIIRLFEDDLDLNQLPNQNVAMYLKITTPLKSDMMCALPSEDNQAVLKPVTDPRSSSTRRNIVDATRKIQNPTELLLPFLQTVAKYYNEQKTSVTNNKFGNIPEQILPVLQTTQKYVSNRSPTNKFKNSEKAMVPILHTTPMFMNEQQMHLQYPTERNIPERTSTLQNLLNPILPLVHPTPKYTIKHETNLQKPAHKNNPELTDNLRQKLRLLVPLLKNMSTKTNKDTNKKRFNYVQQNVADPSSVSRNTLKDIILNDPGKNYKNIPKVTVTQFSNLMNMIPSVNPSSSNPFRNTYNNVHGPHPGNPPGMMADLRKIKGTTFMNYYPYHNSASSKRMKR